MKKLILYILTGLMLLATVACDFENTDHQNDETKASADADTLGDTTAPEAPTETVDTDNAADGKELKSVAATVVATYENLTGAENDAWISTVSRLNAAWETLDRYSKENLVLPNDYDSTFFHNNILLLVYTAQSISEQDFRLEQIPPDGEKLILNFTYDASLDGSDEIYTCHAYLISIPYSELPALSMQIQRVKTNRRTAEDTTPITPVDASLEAHYNNWGPIADYDRAIIKSRAELITFWDALDAKYSSKEIERSESYDDSFFAENLLLACIIQGSSSRTDYALDSVTLRNNFLTVKVSYSAPPHGEDDDTITGYFLIRISKADASDFSGFELLAHNRDAVSEDEQ